MSSKTSSYVCSVDERRKQLEKTCVSLISTYLEMRGSVVNKLTAMPTKGLVVSKQSQQNKEVEEDHDLEGSSVDGPPSNNHQEIASLVNRMIEEQDLPENDAVQLSLPRSLRDQAPRLHQEDFEAFYRVKEKQEHLEASKIPPVQILALYMRSFYNVLEYDLDTVQHLRDRYIGFFGNILADILELCYPQLLTTNYADERVLADLRRHHQGKK